MKFYSTIWSAHNIMTLRMLTPLRWDEVFSLWQVQEEKLEHWQQVWQAKGFSSWREWRQATHANLNGSSLDWKLYEVMNPLETIPDWHGGMFHGWIEHYAGLSQQPPTLQELAHHLYVETQPYIRALIETFPSATILSAITTPNERICLVEGMHRGCAIALAAKRNIRINPMVYVALAQWPSDELPKLGGWDK